MYFSCLGASMLGRGLVLVLDCISLLCVHARSEIEGILCRQCCGVRLGTPRLLTAEGAGFIDCGSASGSAPVAVCGVSVGDDVP
jgi:hypothetical protein